MDKARVIVKANYAQTIGLSGKGVGIAVLDTGLSPSADFLMPTNRIMVFKDFVNGYTQCYDNNGHGTHVCGIVCGNGYMSDGRYCGIAPNASLIVIKILDKMGQGSTYSALKALDWILENHIRYNIRVVNMSVGTNDRNVNSSLINALYKAWDNGICIVSADGNIGSGSSSIVSAGKNKKIITVGSIESPNSSCDVTAPGTDIISCKSANYSFSFHGRSPKKIVGSNYVKMSGTSMATPIVSGATALLIEKNPHISPDELKKLLITTSNNKLINIEELLKS